VGLCGQEQSKVRAAVAVWGPELQQKVLEWRCMGIFIVFVWYLYVLVWYSYGFLMVS